MKKPDFLSVYQPLGKKGFVFVFPPHGLVAQEYTLTAEKLLLPTRVVVYVKKGIDEDTIALNYWWPGFEETIVRANIVPFTPQDVLLPRGWEREGTLFIGINRRFQEAYIAENALCQLEFIKKLFAVKNNKNVRLGFKK